MTGAKPRRPRKCQVPGCGSTDHDKRNHPGVSGRRVETVHVSDPELLGEVREAVTEAAVTPDLLGALQASVDRARAARMTDEVDEAEAKLVDGVIELYGSGPGPVEVVEGVVVADQLVGRSTWFDCRPPWATAAGPDAPVKITLPGMYDLPEQTYHSDPVPGGSLSSTTARALLAPSAPIKAKWARDHPVFKDAYDRGSVVHGMVLGSGPELVSVPHTSWRTNDSKAIRDAARERGAVALLEKDMRECEDMAQAVFDHPFAGELFDHSIGVPEQSMFWQDPDTGIWCRAMVDWSPLDPSGFVVDFKTTRNASKRAIAKSVAEYGYHQQADFYLRGRAALGLPSRPFLFVFVEIDPPYPVTVVQLDDDALAAGHRRNTEALQVWASCSESGHWPGYSEDVETISLPAWATN